MMFSFRLERILLYRQRQVDVCTREVAMAQTKLQAAEQAVAECAQDLDHSRTQAAEDRLSRLVAADMARQLAWHEVLQVRGRECEAAAAAAASKLQTARQRLQQSWQDREVLQQLKERQRHEWARAAARRERRDMDEIGSIQAVLGSRDALGSERTVGHAAGSCSAESDVT